MSDEAVKEEVQSSTEAPATEEPKFTQADLDRISTDSRNKGQRQALKELGFESPEALKARLDALNKYEEKHKSEAQKLADKLAEQQSAIDDANTAKEDALLQLEAIKLGVDPEKVEKAIRLAKVYDGETPADRIKAFLEDVPTFKTGGETQQGPPNISAPVKGQAPSEKATAEAQVRAAMGL